jgi:uncharacterized membrane protein
MTLGIFVGTILIFLGILIISSTEIPKVEEKLNEKKWKGMLYVLIAGFLWGSTAILIREAVIDVGSPVVTNLIANVSSLPVFGLILPFRGYYKVLQKMKKSSMIYLILAGFAMSIASLSYYIALGYGPVIFVSPISGTVPMFAVIMSFLFIQKLERVNLKVVIGTLFVVMGTYLVVASPF